MVVFLMHIPKTAGKTLQSIVRRNYSDKEVFFTYPPERMRLEQHPQRDTLRLVMGHFRFGLHKAIAPRQFGYFTLLREPIAQVVSHFGHLSEAVNRAHSERDKHMAIIEECRTLADFADHPWACNLQTQYLTGWNPEKIREQPARSFERATENLERYFLGVGVTERFDESLAILKTRLSWIDVSYVAKNVGRKSLRSKELDAHTSAIIEENNEVDVRVYEYGRQLMDSMLQLAT